MTLYHFIALPTADQVELLDQSIPLGFRYEDEYIIFLFAHQDFYIEMYRHNIQNHLVRVRPIRTTRLLEPYLNDVDLDSVL